MSSSSNRFKHESLEDSKTIVKYLRALQEGFEKDSIMFTSDGRQLVINPSGLINMEVEAKRKGDDVKLTLQFRWSENESRETDKPPLNIKALTKAG